MMSLCERHFLGAVSSGLCGQQNTLNPGIAAASSTLVTDRVSLLPAQCWEAVAFCLLGFDKKKKPQITLITNVETICLDDSSME